MHMCVHASILKFNAIMENHISDTESVNSSTSSAGNSNERLKALS